MIVMSSPIIFVGKYENRVIFIFIVIFSRHAEKYVRRGRLDWPEGATSRDSIKAVQKLTRLQVCVSIYCKHVLMCV